MNNIKVDVDKFWKSYIKRNEKNLEAIGTRLERIGTYYILRKLILQELSISSRVSSEKFYMILENLNDSMINDTINYRIHNNWSSLPEETIKAENIFIDTLSKLGLRIGLADPLLKVYQLLTTSLKWN